MRLKRLGFICLLCAIGSIFLFADYLHTEADIDPMDNCPICVWQHHSVFTAQLYYLFIAIIFVLLFRFAANRQKVKDTNAYYHFNSRAPPSSSL